MFTHVACIASYMTPKKNIPDVHNWIETWLKEMVFFWYTQWKVVLYNRLNLFNMCFFHCTGTYQ